jgi:hypothetical protein
MKVMVQEACSAGSSLGDESEDEKEKIKQINWRN